MEIIFLCIVFCAFVSLVNSNIKKLKQQRLAEKEKRSEPPKQTKEDEEVLRLIAKLEQRKAEELSPTSTPTVKNTGVHKIVVDKAAVGLFKNRTDIEVVEVLPGVEIHANEFQGCTNLRQISIPDGLMGIGSYAFQDCKSLKDITLPNSNMLIGSNAFSGCTALEHIKIGRMTCLIYENAFEGCEKLIVEAPYGTFPISEFRELLKETAKTVSPEKSPPDNYVAAWTKEMMRQVDIRRKAAEKTVQKAEEPKPSPAPAPVDADALSAIVASIVDKTVEKMEMEKSAQKAPAEPAENTPEGLSVLRSLPAVWVVLGTGLQKQWPAIDIQGFFHVFTDEGAATAFAQPNGFAVEKMVGIALCDRLKEWQRYGITHMLLHQGGRTREFLEKELGYESNFNGDLQQVMIRYLQTKALNIDGAAETAKIFWMLLCKMIPERLFLVPFCFEGEDTNAPVEDNTLRLFPSAAKLITKQRAEGKILLFDGYPFADKADGRPLHFRTLRSVTTGKEVLPVYTDFHEMLPIWQGRAHFALATFDDFKDNYQPASGVIINPISQALLLEPKDIEEIKKS